MAASATDCVSLLERFQHIPDPRDPRGVRHTLAWLLALASAAVLAGSRSFTAIGEWIADAPAQVMAALGVRRDPLSKQWRPPDESTVRRLLEKVDARALDEAVCSWPAERAARTTPAPGKTNEITRFQPLLQPLDLNDCVITADALHTQRDHAVFLAEQKRAHYLLIVKKNQPTLYAQVKRLLWKQIPIQNRERDCGNGRDEHRTLKVVTAKAGLLFPHATLRNLAIGALRLAGADNLAQAARRISRNATRSLPILGLT